MTCECSEFCTNAYEDTANKRKVASLISGKVINVNQTYIVIVSQSSTLKLMMYMESECIK